ncbi:MAG: hypothetical protein NUW23_07095 [Firmicutes bacterium]|nr:hypothetical protein [Bacillota bacterium]
MHHGEVLRRFIGEKRLLQLVQCGPGGIGLSKRDSAAVSYAISLTLNPASVGADGVRRLREAGFSDREILDINQVVSYFNYSNRVASGLGLEVEPGDPYASLAEKLRDASRSGVPGYGSGDLD